MTTDEKPRRRFGVCVYIIEQCGGDDSYVKIGVAIDPEQRVKELQVGNPLPLRLAQEFGPWRREIAMQAEYRAHKKLAEKQACGEWFRCSLQEASAVVRRASVWVKHKRADVAYTPHLKAAKSLGVKYEEVGRGAH